MAAEQIFKMKVNGTKKFIKTTTTTTTTTKQSIATTIPTAIRKTTTSSTTTTAAAAATTKANHWIKQHFFKQAFTSRIISKRLRRRKSLLPMQQLPVMLLLLLLHMINAAPPSLPISSEHKPTDTIETQPLASPLLSSNNNLPPTTETGSNATSDFFRTLRQRPALDMNMIQRNFLAATTNDQNRALKRVFLSNRTITCNDGSHAGFYLRKNANSKKWIVFLEGGWHCYDTRSCRARWLRLRHLMTSAQWPETRDVGGILSPQPEENPYWHNANHVLVPYCSSDSWSGTRSVLNGSRDDWRFMGALIIRQVIADLIPLGLGRSTGAELLLVGSSAGGLGVILNLDRIRNFLQNERNLQVQVRGVSDSGWFLDREPYTPAAVASSESVRRGWKMWQGQLPEDCTKEHETEPWRCYFGYRLYPTLKTPLFVFQWLFDEAQMRADNVGAPVTPQQWNYIHEMGGALRSSLDNVTAVFAPSCIGHAVLSKRDWVNIKIDDISLPSALRCWEHATRKKRHDKLKRSTEATNILQQHNNQRHQKHRQRLQKHNHLDNSNNNNNNTPAQRKHNQLSKEQREERKRRRQEQQARRKQRRRNHKRNKQHNNNEAYSNVYGNLVNDTKSEAQRNQEQQQQNFYRQNPPQHQRKHNQNQNNDEAHRLRQEQRRQRRRKAKQHHHKDDQLQHEQPVDQQLLASLAHKTRASNTAATTSTSSSSATPAKRRHRVPRVPEKCSLRLLERCSWPQCNHSCPTLTNPLTGEEMRFLELLTSFGLDIEAVAAALGVDMHTLNNMDRTELVSLLTQQVS